jgi:hypothetical protein
MVIQKESPVELLRRFNEAQSQLVIQTADLPLGTLAGMVESRAIDLEPTFQRRERWSSDKQSALIESFLINVPVPPVYLSEEASGRYTAIDGKQRLRAIADFISDRFRLRKLERFTEAEGYTFSEFPEEVRNTLYLRPYLRVVTLLRQTDPALKYEVFLRLNRGGEILNPQEIRNVAFRGALNDAIYELARSPFLRQQLKIENDNAAAFRKMDDAEYVLRFLTLSSSVHFRGSLVNEMNGFMAENQDVDLGRIGQYRELFAETLGRCAEIWGDLAFKRPENDGWRDQFLAGMYDAQMLAVSKLADGVFERSARKRDRVIAGTRDLFGDPRFEEAVRTGTNTPQRIEYRVNRVLELVKNIGNE